MKRCNLTNDHLGAVHGLGEPLRRRSTRSCRCEERASLATGWLIVRVLIVGAGIGGMSTAIALRQRGFDPVIIERSPAPSNEGASIYDSGKRARALALLGVLDDAAARSVVVNTSAFVYQDEGRNQRTVG